LNAPGQQHSPDAGAIESERGVRDNTCRLVDHNNVGILKNDLKLRHILRSDLQEVNFPVFDLYLKDLVNL
jgi:hypothetical protein